MFSAQVQNENNAVTYTKNCHLNAEILLKRAVKTTTKIVNTFAKLY